VENYISVYRNVSRSAVILAKKLLYQTDGMNFDEALTAGTIVNAEARMTEDCRKGIARFFEKN